MTTTKKPTKKAQQEAAKTRMHKWLDRDDQKGHIFIERALLALYARQTADEKVVGTASHDNNMGFGGTDAEFMTDVAKWVLKGEEKGIPEGRRITKGQRPHVRKKLKKYWRQLVEIEAAAKAGQ